MRHVEQKACLEAVTNKPNCAGYTAMLCHCWGLAGLHLFPLQVDAPQHICGDGVADHQYRHRQ